MNQQNLPFEFFGQEGVKYRCLEQIGLGCQGIVYKGIQIDQPQQLLAIKFSDNIRDDELQFLYKLKNTSNNFKYIIKYYEIIDNSKIMNGQDNSQLKKLCFVMELGSKNLLEEIIQSPIQKSESQKIEIIHQIALGIQELHNFKHIHRDIKPENIIKVGDVWKLCDFGFIKHSISKNQTQLVGTPYYISPEVFIQEKDQIEYNEKVDIWSFGCIIYEILTGNLFFNGNSAEDVTQQIANFYYTQRSNHKESNTDQRFKNITNQFMQNLCKCMMTVDPQQRYDIHQVVEELNKNKPPSISLNTPLQIPPKLQSNSNFQPNIFLGHQSIQPNQIPPFLNRQSQQLNDTKLTKFNSHCLQINNNQLNQPQNNQIQYNTLQSNKQQFQPNKFPLKSQPQQQSQPQPSLQSNQQSLFQIPNQQQAIQQGIPKQSLQIESQNVFNFQKVEQNQNITQNNSLDCQKQQNIDPKQSLQIESQNFLNFQKVEQNQNITQNINLDNQKQQYQDKMSQLLDKIIKTERKSEIMKYVLQNDREFQINSFHSQNTVKIQENLLQTLNQFISDQIQSKIK